MRLPAPALAYSVVGFFCSLSPVAHAHLFFSFVSSQQTRHGAHKSNRKQEDDQPPRSSSSQTESRRRKAKGPSQKAPFPTRHRRVARDPQNAKVDQHAACQVIIFAPGSRNSHG